MYSLKKFVICLLLWQCENTLASNATDGLKLSSVGPEMTKTNDKDLHDLFSSKSNTSSLLNENKSTVNGAVLSSSGKNDTQSVMNTLAVSAVEGGGKVKFDDKIKTTDDVHSTTPLSAPLEVDIKNLNLGENGNSEDGTPITVSEKFEPSKKSSKIVPRKGVIPQDTGKIYARKGVNELSGEIPDNSDISMEEKSKSIENKTNCICCPNTTVNDKLGNESTNSCKICCDEADKNVPLIKNVTNITPNNSLPASGTSSPSATNNNNTLNSSSTNASKSTSLNTLAPTPPPIVRNKKPLITSDIPYDTSTNISSNQQSVPEKNTQSKSDYVVPVVGIILAVPLIIILVLVLYKKGSEFWERRHYRRMDFLIDGMYNE